MLSYETITTFFLSALILGLSPGPDNIFVLTQSALGGRLAGVFVTLGLCTGLLFHTTAVALGVAVIFQTSPLAFTLLKAVGVLYLLYLAYGALRASSSEITIKQGKKRSYRDLYVRGIIMNITNPKVSIFFLAFLPQFIDASQGNIPYQIAQLGGIFLIATLIVFNGVAILAGSIGDWLADSERAQITLNRVAATIFIGIALKLALTSQN